ncbi:MAG: NAD(+) synthase, partial [Clostridia bacterium]
TSNRSERYVGYFTKWGDNACDFNPISDLTVKEVYTMLDYLECPRTICKKQPSAGLMDGQTDERDFGFTYKELDDYLMNKNVGDNFSKIQYMHSKAGHKINGMAQFEQKDCDNN